MDRTGDDPTRIQTPRRTLACQSQLLQIDPRAELIFETPPPDVVSSLNKCFEEFTGEKRRGSPGDSDSDSGGSLFITQSVAKAIRTLKRRTSSRRSEFTSDHDSDESERDSSRGPRNDDTAYEERHGDHRQHSVLLKRGRKHRKPGLRCHISPKRAIFPFLLKSQRRQRLPIQKHQILENAEMGGFLKCIEKIQESFAETRRGISLPMLESVLSKDSEMDEQNSDHEVTVVDKAKFVPDVNKKNRQKWLPQSILEKREKIGSRKKDKRKAKQRSKKNASVKKANSKARKARTQPQPADRTFSICSSESEVFEVLAASSDAEPTDSAQSREPHTQQINQADENPGDEAPVVVVEETQRLNSVQAATQSATNMVHDVENGNTVSSPQGGGISILNDTQQHDSDIGSLDLFMQLDHQDSENIQAADDGSTLIADNSETIRTGTDVIEMEDPKEPMAESETLLPDEEASNHSLRGTSAIACAGAVETVKVNTHMNMGEGCEDSDVTQIEIDDESVSLLGPGIVDGNVSEIHKKKIQHSVTPPDDCISLGKGEQEENNTNDLSVSLTTKEFGTEEDETEASVELQLGDLIKKQRRKTKELMKRRTLSKKTKELDASVDVEDAIHQRSIEQSEMHDTSQGSVDPHTEPLSDRDEEIRSPSKKKKSSLPCKDIEVARVEETLEMPPASKLLTVGDEPEKDAHARSYNNAIAGGERTMLEMSIETEDSPLFKHAGLSFLKRKRKRNKEIEPPAKCLDFIQCDTNVDKNQNGSVVSHSDDITGLETLRDEKELRETNIETNEAVSQSENTPELLGTSDVSLQSDSIHIMEIKKKKKKQKLKEREVAEPDSGADIVENVQYIASQTTELLPKRSKKNKKHNDRKRPSNIVENISMNSLSNETLDGNANQPVELRGNDLIDPHETTESNQLEHTQTSEEVEDCPSLSLTVKKSVKKKKRKAKGEKRQCDSIDLDLDVSSVSQVDVTSSRVAAQQEDRSATQQFTEERPCDDSVIEHLDSISVSKLNVSKRKKKRQNLSCSSQDDDITGLKQTVSVSGDTEELLEKTSNLSMVSDSTVDTKVKKKKRKKQKLEDQEDAELVSDVHVESVETIQHSESQTTELSFEITEKKRKEKKHKRTIHQEDDNATISPSNERLDHMTDGSDSRVNDLINSSEATEISQLEDTQPSDTLTGCSSPSDTKLSVKKQKKKKKRDRTEKLLYETADLNLDMSSMSQFDDLNGLRTFAQEEDRSTSQQVIQERSSDVSVVEYLENTTVGKLNVAKRKKKRQNLNSSTQDDDITGLKQTVSVSQSVDTAELQGKTSNVSIVSDSTVDTKVKKKKRKKQELEDQEDAELDSDVHVQLVETIQHSESQTTELSFKIAKKKRKEKKHKRTIHQEDDNATISPSNERLDHMADGSAESRVNCLISEATEISQLEDTQPSDALTGCSSPSETKLSVKKKKKKKEKDESKEHQYDSVDLNLDVSSVSRVGSVNGLRAVLQQEDKSATQQITEERPCDADVTDQLDCKAAGILKVAKRKKKRQNLNTSTQDDDISGLKQTVSVSQSVDTAEILEKSNLSMVSDSTVDTKFKKKKRKKQKLEDQEDAELGSHVQLVETIQHSESQTTGFRSKKLKKKKKDKKQEGVMDQEEYNATISPSNERLDHMADGSDSRVNGLINSSEATEISQLEDTQPSDTLTGCSSPSDTKLSVKKKKKKERDRKDKHRYDSVDLDQDASSLFDDVTGLRSTSAQFTDERQDDDLIWEHLGIDTVGELKVAKPKKKRKSANLFINDNSLAQAEETVIFKKKKRKQTVQTENCTVKAD